MPERVPGVEAQDFAGIRPACSAGFPTCCDADFQIGSWWNAAEGAGLEARDTADLEVCATSRAFSEWRPPPTGIAGEPKRICVGIKHHSLVCYLGKPMT